jgi:hypothetical protein
MWHPENKIVAQQPARIAIRGSMLYRVELISETDE